MYFYISRFHWVYYGEKQEKVSSCIQNCNYLIDFNILEIYYSIKVR